MRVYPPGARSERTVAKVFCDLCSESCQRADDMPESVEHAELRATWGYFSDKDLTEYSVDLCEKCFDKVVACMKEMRTKNPYVLTLGGSKLDPLEGFDYGPDS